VSWTKIPSTCRFLTLILPAKVDAGCCAATHAHIISKSAALRRTEFLVASSSSTSKVRISSMRGDPLALLSSRAMDHGSASDDGAKGSHAHCRATPLQNSSTTTQHAPTNIPNSPHSFTSHSKFREDLSSGSPIHQRKSSRLVPALDYSSYRQSPGCTSSPNMGGCCKPPTKTIA